MELNEYVYDPKGNSNSTLFSLSKGTFTFLAGTIAKTGNMKVETPVGTMGIRGTAPHVEILDDGTVKFSTLIEENKSATEVHKSAPVDTPRQRRAQNAVTARYGRRPTSGKGIEKEDQDLSGLLAAIASLVQTVSAMSELKKPRFFRPISSAHLLFQNE